MPLKRNIRYDADEEVGKAHKKLCNTSITGGEVGGGGDVHVEDIEMEANKQAALSNWCWKRCYFLVKKFNNENWYYQCTLHVYEAHLVQ